MLIITINDNNKITMRIYHNTDNVNENANHNPNANLQIRLSTKYISTKYAEAGLRRTIK